MGEGEEHAVTGYDTNEKKYTYNSFNSMGEAISSKGTVSGGTWTWLSETKTGKTVTKVRFTLKEVSPTSYTFKIETSPDGAKWTTAGEGKATKTGPK